MVNTTQGTQKSLNHMKYICLKSVEYIYHDVVHCARCLLKTPKPKLLTCFCWKSLKNCKIRFTNIASATLNICCDTHIYMGYTNISDLCLIYVLIIFTKPHFHQNVERKSLNISLILSLVFSVGEMNCFMQMWLSSHCKT